MLEGVWRKWNPPTVLVGIYIGASIKETVWRLFKKIKLEWPYTLAIPLLGIYPEKMKALTHKDTWAPMFNIYKSQDMEATLRVLQQMNR